MVPIPDPEAPVSPPNTGPPITFDGAVPPPDSNGALPQQIGRYSISRVLGRGGLGIVYLGYDPPLKRWVAVKRILAEGRSHPQAVARFRVEAEAIARLDHPNIIKVYEVGEDAGQSYLALELVEGPTLAAHLVDGPLAPHAAAKLIAAIAHAVGHAHQHGVVHRDLKPANILLVGVRGPGSGVSAVGPSLTPDPYPLTPKVADFGLAKQLGHDEGLTQTGIVLGTPMYMAPEQTVGDPAAVGPAADVWALGVILYECLTGRPPFRGVTTLATMELARTGDPLSPRSVLPSVPHDLSTICLKCLEKNPTQRYPTANDLANDLEAWLAGRPIQARPAGRIARGLKWARRNPTGAALAAAAVVVPVLAAAGITIHSIRLQDALDQKTAEEQRTRAEKNRADENDRQARAALRKMLDHMTDRRYVGVPRIRELHKAQAEEALAYFQHVSTHRDDPSPEVRYDAALANLDAAKLAEALGRTDEGVTYARRGESAFRQLVDEFPEDRRYRLQFALALSWLGAYRTTTDGVIDQNVRDFTDAIRILRSLASDPTASLAEQVALANAVNTLGAVHFKANRFVEAEEHFREAYESRKALTIRHPENQDLPRQLAQNALNLGLCYQMAQRPEEATRLNDEAGAILQKLLDADPDDRGAAANLAIVRVIRSYLHEVEGRRATAIDQLSRLVAPLDRLVLLEPSDSRIRDALFRVHGRRAELYAGNHQPQEALRDGERMVEYCPAEEKRLRRWHLARYRRDADDLAGCLADLEALLREFPIQVPVAELIHGAETAALTANRARTLAAVCGAAVAIHLDRADELAVTVLRRVRSTCSAADWTTQVEGIRKNPTFHPLLTHPDFAALVLGK